MLQRLPQQLHYTATAAIQVLAVGFSNGLESFGRYEIEMVSLRQLIS